MLITFEGLDGSGKTTQIQLLADYLTQQGIEFILTREPGGTPIGEQIRDCLHDVNNTAMTPETEILLYSASRAQIVGEVIRPAVQNGKLVLCDRFYDSTLAYQGYGRGLDLDALTQITAFATGGLKPNLTIFFELDIHTGLRRRVQGGEEMNRMDRQTAAFYERVGAGYSQLMAAEPARWQVVRADRPVDEIQKELRQIIDNRLARLSG